jgi:hypothetical protein
MGKFIAEQTVKNLVRNGWQVKDAPIIVLGLTFKEDCADLRNSRVIDVVRELQSYGAEVIVHDPVAASRGGGARIWRRAGSMGKTSQAAAIVAAVAHRAFKARPAADYLERLLPNAVLVDVKSQFSAAEFTAKDVTVCGSDPRVQMTAIDSARERLAQRPLRWLVTGQRPDSSARIWCRRCSRSISPSPGSTTSPRAIGAISTMCARR